MPAERAFRRLITTNLPAPDFEFTPIESRGSVDGVPDVFWDHGPSRLSGWLEVKVTGGWAVDLRPHQVRFLQGKARRGVRTAVAVRQIGTGRDGVMRDVLWLVAGQRAAALAAEGLPQGLHAQSAPGILGRFTGGPRQWSWPKVAAALLA